MGIPIVVKNDLPNNSSSFQSPKKKNNYDNERNEVVLINEVKRLGLLIDRYVDLELRLGDNLVIYIQRASAWDNNTQFLIK